MVAFWPCIRYYLYRVIVLTRHTAYNIKDSIRFLDYTIGVFDGFETRNAVKKGVKNERFLINGVKAETGTWISNGDVIELLAPKNRPKAYQMDVDIVYQDHHLAIVNKPAGIVVSGNRFKTLEHALINQLEMPDLNDALDWALPIHRLDAPTSGLVIFAKTRSARRALGEMLESKDVRKTYHAIVHGSIDVEDITSEVNGKSALTKVSKVRSVASLKNDQISLVALQPVTGRTHQLRIHCASVGCPIVGDQLHGDPQNTFRNKGLMLAATRVEFVHPITGGFIDIEVPVPPKFQSLLEREARRAKRYFKD